MIGKNSVRHYIAFALLFLTLFASSVYAQDSVTARIKVTAKVGEPVPPPPENLEDWVIYYFGADNNFSAESDFDGDGHLDYLEFYAGTDPTDRASKLRIIETTLSGSDVTIKWSPTRSGENITRKYRIFRGSTDALGALTDPQATIEDLQNNPNITEPAGAEIESEGPSTSYLDSNAVNDFPLFYKVILSQPLPQAPQ